MKPWLDDEWQDPQPVSIPSSVAGYNSPNWNIRAGCLTCRKRKVKCDENRPICKRCTGQPYSCDWPATSNSLAVGSGAQSALFRGQPKARVHIAKMHMLMNANIPPSLTETKLECANSITLTRQERHIFGYFSSSTVHDSYDFGPWGTLQYLVKEVAPSSSGITRMILALSASEMHKKGILASPNSKALAVDVGLYHYNLALEHLHSCLIQ